MGHGYRHRPRDSVGDGAGGDGVNRQCPNKGCQRPVHARGRCSRCYQFWQLTGKPRPPVDAPLGEKLTPEDAAAIRRSYIQGGPGPTLRELVAAYDVDHSTVWRIVRGKSWAKQ
jgi:hypothetical protein